MKPQFHVPILKYGQAVQHDFAEYFAFDLTVQNIGYFCLDNCAQLFGIPVFIPSEFRFFFLPAQIFHLTVILPVHSLHILFCDFPGKVTVHHRFFLLLYPFQYHSHSDLFFEQKQSLHHSYPNFPNKQDYFFLL